MFRCVAADSVPMALKSLSADQPAGSTGNGKDVCVVAMLICISLRKVDEMF